MIAFPSKAKGPRRLCFGGIQTRARPRGDEHPSIRAYKRAEFEKEGRDKREIRSTLFFFSFFSSPTIAFRRGAPPPTSLSLSQPLPQNHSFFLQTKKNSTTTNSVDSRKIKNPTLRNIFDGAVDMGADAAGKAEKFWDTLSK